jgi:hypothetical protein
VLLTLSHRIYGDPTYVPPRLAVGMLELVTGVPAQFFTIVYDCFTCLFTGVC